MVSPNIVAPIKFLNANPVNPSQDLGFLTALAGCATSKAEAGRRAPGSQPFRVTGMG